MSKSDLRDEAGVLIRSLRATVTVLFSVVVFIAGFVMIGGALGDLFGDGGTHYLEKAGRDIVAVGVYLYTDSRALSGVVAFAFLLFGTHYWRSKMHGEGYMG